ncbi:metal ABC transporter permease [Paracandidimonas soli]|uniref:metal ABC transporter permease n=1 Tax=Paracandidimonas soli TaxID=1917182 RepID=UPI0033407FE0
MNAILEALLLQAGYNTALVCIGAALLGAAAGAIGAFVLLRRRSLATDAAGHATLPGLALAFIILALLTGDGRWLPGLMIGASCSAALGLFTVHWLSMRTRLKEDAAIGMVLSVFFGAGIVLMTVIQTLQTGRQAGIASYLLGSAAGMLRSEAELIALMALLTALSVFALRRPLAMLCFDPDYASVLGLRVRLMDLALSGILLLVVVASLKVVGLVLSVALSIMPAVAARFWTNRVHLLVPISAGIGAAGAYTGAALSSTAPSLPTGAIIVLTLFLLFLLSMLLAPARGVLATFIRHQLFRRRVHLRQGLLSLNRGEAIYDGLTLRLLRRRGWIRRDGVATPAGHLAANAAARDEALWALYRRLNPGSAALAQYHRILPVREALPQDTVQELESQFARETGFPQPHRA